MQCVKPWSVLDICSSIEYPWTFDSSDTQVAIKFAEFSGLEMSAENRGEQSRRAEIVGITENTGNIKVIAPVSGRGACVNRGDCGGDRYDLPADIVQVPAESKCIPQA